MGIFSRFRKRHQEKPPKATVIVPLYIYPASPATWQPLFNAIDKNPSIDFVVIVNPNSGPGEAPWWPNSDYLREIPKLNQRPNVTTVGYIRVDYCNRDSSDVIRDIGRYAAWPHDSGVRHLYVEGIFFDETPNEHSQFKGTYLEKIAQEVRAMDGILGEKLVINNPGTIPDYDLMKKTADITVVFEESSERLQELEEDEKDILESCDRAKTCYMVHSAPPSMIREITRDARHRAQYVFVTGRSQQFYEHLGDEFDDFIAAMVAE